MCFTMPSTKRMLRTGYRVLKILLADTIRKVEVYVEAIIQAWEEEKEDE